MMRDAFKSGASIEEVLTAIREHLNSKRASEPHIQTQLEYARKLKLKA
ncbi:MAG: hypothetical protein ACR2KT_15185 [Methylocella sp.]